VRFGSQKSVGSQDEWRTFTPRRFSPWTRASQLLLAEDLYMTGCDGRQDFPSGEPHSELFF
jgi:hypothetical protein